MKANNKYKRQKPPLFSNFPLSLIKERGGLIIFLLNLQRMLKLKKIKFFLPLLILILLFFACNHLEIIKDEVNRNLKNEIKIVHISDLHLKRDKKIYQKVIDTINNIDPDLLFITGDSVSNNKKLPLLNKILSKLNKSIKKYAILGNHEYFSKLNINDLEDTYKKNGVKLLVNSGETFTIKETVINLWGMDDYVPNLKNFNYMDDAINIIMVHCPVYFDEIAKKYPDNEIIVLSGHTHGGQIIFFGKPILLPEGCGNYLKGKYIKGKLCLYVSKGIGNTGIDLRIHANPDIIFIGLK